MNYIDAETFLKQSEEVQKVLLDWWKPEMYDLFFRNFTNANGFLKGIYKGCIQDYEMEANATRDNTFLPLLSETQLRKFIEDKLNCKCDISYISKELVKNEKSYYRIERSYFVSKKSNFWRTETDDLLQSYWEVACEIALEGNI